jgi:hypothetical protein
MSDEMSDELMQRLADARPLAPAGVLEADNDLLEEIVMTEPIASRRVVTPRRLSAAAAAAAVLVAVALVVPTRHAAAPRSAAPVRVVPNMRTIAESTAAALSSGRAHVTYTSDNGHFIHDSGSFVVEFSGDNRSTAGTIDPGDGRGSAFPIANKVVDGRFYLQDGTRWVEDTNEHVTGSDLFSADPRTLVSGAAQDAEFEEAGTATVDGVATRQLKATRLDKVPVVNLGLGPTADQNTKVTTFDVWVDEDNVVRRLELDTEQTETVYPLARTQITKDADGTVHKSLDQSDLGKPETRTQRNAYSVTFTDIGAVVEIVAPANAAKVAGQG